MNNRIKELMNYYHLSQTDMARKIGTTNQYFSAIINDKRDVGKNTLKKILEGFPEVSKYWLITGEGKMFDKEVVSEKVINGYYFPDVSASAGLDTELNNNELKKIPVTIPGWEKDIIFINVYGDSMYPKYNAGEIIGIKPIEFQYINYGYPYVVVFKNGDVYIKIIQPGRDSEHLILESVNDFYKPKEFNLNLIKSFFSIKGVLKKELM